MASITSHLMSASSKRVVKYTSIGGAMSLALLSAWVSEKHDDKNTHRRSSAIIRFEKYDEVIQQKSGKRRPFSSSSSSWKVISKLPPVNDYSRQESSMFDHPKRRKVVLQREEMVHLR